PVMPLRLPQPEGVGLAIWTYRPALAQVANDFIGVDRIMIDEPVKLRAGGHEAVGEGTAGLYIPLTRIEADNPPQDHLLVLPLSDPCRRPGKGKSLPLRPWSRGRRGRWRTRHIQKQEERQDNGEHSSELA